MRPAGFAVTAVLLVGCASVPSPSPPPPDREAPAAASPVAREIEAFLSDAPATTGGGRSGVVSAAAGAHDAGDLAKATQNPVSDLISLPFQSNFNFGVGPDDDTQYVLNVQPIWPFRLGADWSLITRTILPVVYQPEAIPGAGDDFGLGDTTFTGFVSPAKPGKLIWGAGPAVLIPTSTGRQLGAGEWGLGPSAVVVRMDGPWVFGALASNIWGFEGEVNSMTLQPFVNYNLAGGWYVVSAPLVTANWEADGDETWTVPVGAGIGKVAHIGKQPVNVSCQLYYNVERPAGGPEWSLRVAIQLLFPK